MASSQQPPPSPPPEPGEGAATDRRPAAEPSPVPSEFNELLFAKTLLTSVSIGIMAIASAGRFMFCNEPMRRMFGLTEEHLQRDAQTLFEQMRDQLVDPESLGTLVNSIRAGEREDWHDTIELRDGRAFELTVRRLRHEGQSLGSLWLCRDVTEQRKSQEAQKMSEASLRAVVQEQERLIATIREIGTPVLPIYNRVLVLPLVGHIESTRSAHLMDALLESIQHHQASVVIIDITGVSLVDTSVANSLIQSTQAAALLGAHCVLVGISAAVSRTIVHLGVDLTQVTTRRDLQAGFAFALNYLGYAIQVIKEEPDWLAELDLDGETAEA
jgi:PAS domain S-box-containing protein